jgi:multidrug efflux pump subunit AcrA (membrane-fusion protein)
VDRAHLQLERTTLTAPFNAIILSRDASVGTQATAAQPLAQLAGTDRYYIEAAIPHDLLSWLTIPGAKARIEATTGAQYEGEVIQLLGSLETQGRMVKLLISIDDPLGRLHPREKPLLINEYVTVQLSGIVLEQISVLPRKALRSDQTVWVNENNALTLYPVEILFREEHELLVRGLPDHALVILSDLSTPIPQMPVISEESIR